MKSYLSRCLRHVCAVACFAAATATTVGVSATSVQAAATNVTGRVATAGSTSMEHLVGALGESFSELNPQVKFTYNPTGSGAGITAAEEGRTDIGLSSRALKGDELTKLDSHLVAVDGIVVIVNKNNPLHDLTLDELTALYKGEVTNWQELGGDNRQVVLIGREAGSGTRDGFESVTNTKNQAKYRQELTSTGDVITTVSQNPNAVGYASLAAVSDKIKVVTINGVSPSADTVRDGSYKLQRPFVMVTKKATNPESKDAALTPAVKAFIDYALSPEASDIIKLTGAIPVNQ